MKAEKQGNRRKQKTVYGICGILLILALLPLLLRSNRQTDIQAEVLFLGDSLIGQYRDETSIPWLVSRQTGMTVFNGDFGGTTMSQQNREGQDAFYWNGLSFSQLAKAAAAQDFGGQQTIRTKDYVTMHFGDIVDELDRLDFSSVRTLVVSYGMNDYTTGSPIRNPDNPEDTYTMEGAMRAGIRFLRQSYPSLRIIFVSPTYCWFLNSEEEPAATVRTVILAAGIWRSTWRPSAGWLRSAAWNFWICTTSTIPMKMRRTGIFIPRMVYIPTRPDGRRWRRLWPRTYRTYKQHIAGECTELCRDAYEAWDGKRTLCTLREYAELITGERTN